MADFTQYTPLMWFSKKRIYLDYASAPPVLSEAIRRMREVESLVGNPGAIHAEGVTAKKCLDDSRKRIAELLGCKAREIVFTSGLTEANNLAILGFARELSTRLNLVEQGSTLCSLKGTHWIVSSIEHDSVLECFAEIERMGGSVSHVEPDERGLILPESVLVALRLETVFVSVGWANNEIGIVQPLAKIVRTLRDFEEKQGRPVVFHTDAGQAPLYLPTLINSLGVDLLSLGGNKLYGPHGIGALYLSSRVALAPVVVGGKQERGLRAGTESAALAAGFAAAFEVVAKERRSETERLQKLRDDLAREIVARIPGTIVNGALDHALPHMLNVSIPDISSEYVTLALDSAGIAVSTKSACREGEERMSHVVLALGDAKNAAPSVALAKEERASNTIRFSLGRETTMANVRNVASVLCEVIKRT